MKLYLVQHGEALAGDVDPARPLSAGGRRDVEAMAAFLAARELEVARVLHSGKLRAQQTAERFAETLTPGRPPEQRAGLNPMDPVEDLARAAPGWGEDVMVVGHLPFMGRLVSYLIAGTDGPALVDFRPGSVVCLEYGDEGKWSLAWMLRPELVA